MVLTRQVHILMDPEQWAALEALAREHRKATGEIVTLGKLIREAVADYLAKHQKAPAEKPASQPNRRKGIQKASTAK